MEETDHHLLVGADAQAFARSRGFEIETDLNSGESRKLWNDWKRRVALAGPVDPQKRAEISNRVMAEMFTEGLIDPIHVYGTINCDGVNSKGEICGVTTTSGLAWKVPGRVGDSPILGAGTYADEGGAASATGQGEGIMRATMGRVAVDAMLAGHPPGEAASHAIARMVARVGADAGIILVDRAGRLGWARSTPAMSWAAVWDGLEAPEGGI
jgi:isoaspartyl peptidase/L-asparaginase-like protein (Ntn-hydrolase superfamily)